MKITRPSQFALKTVKRADNGGLIVKCRSSQEEEDITVNEKDDKESDRIPHPDLMKILEGLTWVIVDVFGVKLFGSVDKKCKKPMEEWEAGIKVNAVHLSGDEENPGCIVSATLTTRNGQKTAVNTPRIALKGDSYGFETTLEGEVKKLIEETQAYIYEGKGATIDMGLQVAKDDDKKGEKEKAA